jgi:Arc/MetJ-type ribon-helix-helix transcriptional regulator
MTIHLSKELESNILAVVNSGRYASVDDAMAAAASLLLERIKQEQAQATQPAETLPAGLESRKPIWEVIEQENQSIPPEVWAALPPDLSEQHDHYIYGTPKRPTQ